MSAQDRHIPVLDEETDYSTWKKKVEIWKLGTNAKPNQQAAAGHHSQTTSGRIKPSITTIPSTILTQVTGTGFTKDPTSREGAKDQPTWTRDDLKARRGDASSVLRLDIL